MEKELWKNEKLKLKAKNVISSFLWDFCVLRMRL
jgi:hypothetical protein